MRAVRAQVIERSHGCSVSTADAQCGGKKDEGARRNRTADMGFADPCLTTWRPRHRLKKQKPQTALPENRKPTCRSDFWRWALKTSRLKVYRETDGLSSPEETIVQQPLQQLWLVVFVAMEKFICMLV
jgi:hypothetical protein